jgi:hypothetical protein
MSSRFYVILFLKLTLFSSICFIGISEISILKVGSMRQRSNGCDPAQLGEAIGRVSDMSCHWDYKCECQVRNKTKRGERWSTGERPCPTAK